MDTIEIPINEYNNMKKELSILRNQELLSELNDIIKVLYNIRYGLYMGDFTDDLQEASLNDIKEWINSAEGWDEI
jgi:hypothetical protein